MSERLTLAQLRDFLDTARAQSIIPDDAAGYWIRIPAKRVRAAFDAGLAPFSAVERSIPASANTTYTLPRGTPFVPLYR